MKLMKHITIALVLCAIPAMAFGQVAQCEGCDHKVSVYSGSGGLIATADGDAEMVNWRSTCNDVTRTGTLTPDADGVVSALFSEDNNLACMVADDDNAFEIGPIMDGGWFWIHHGDNSAVGNLVAKNVLDNDTVTITSAGGVTMTKGEGAVLLAHTASGRVGLLPNILPVPPPADPPATNYCSYTGKGATAKPENTNCMLKDGSTTIRAQGPADAYTGTKATIMNGGTVTRPTATGATVAITYDLWSAGGQYGSGTGATATIGHPGGGPLAASYGAAAASGGPGSIDDISTAGLAVANAESVGTLTISPTASYCNSKATPPVNHSVTVTVTATVDNANQLTPPIKDTNSTTDGNQAATHKITVVCPAASSQMGVELVPENPFPVQ